MSENSDQYKPVLPKGGQLIIEELDELVLCKPRLIPLKSFTLEKLEKMQQAAQATLQEQKLAQLNE